MGVRFEHPPIALMHPLRKILIWKLADDVGLLVTRPDGPSEDRAPSFDAYTMRGRSFVGVERWRQPQMVVPLHGLVVLAG
eukprot:CAMPEP_0183718230 /NCGR_PEP_ID=MMETSP0737-20130205/11548_1 /TAXON_ID=385413 /ORGANISM="Thalassiosira miniscula, Strain CCMP1093" /LENGTH=79 /DNA_ID=CAMNT_0025947751 /DNA_START=448 /DNA_END=687 /DNA_ORIENTATION=-